MSGPFPGSFPVRRRSDDRSLNLAETSLTEANPQTGVAANYAFADLAALFARGFLAAFTSTLALRPDYSLAIATMPLAVWRLQPYGG